MAIFDHTHPKIIKSTLSFSEFVPACKKSVYLMLTRVLLTDWPHPLLTMFNPKIFNHLFISINLCQHAKNQLTPSINSEDTVNFRVQRPDWPHPFLTMPNQKFSINFYFLWICINKQRPTIFHLLVLDKWLS